MKCIAKTSNKRGFDIIDKEEPIFDQDLVLVEVDFVSICGTDLHLYNWDRWAEERISLPRVIGHEGTGKIVKIGSNVKNSFNGAVLKENQRVSFESHIPCLNCYQCKTNRMNICSNLKLLGLDVDGLFRKYVSVPPYVLIPNDLEGPYAAILEPLGNAFHALSRVDIRGKYIGILGDGPIALFLYFYASKFGASKIFLVGASDYRMNIAKKLEVNNSFILNFYGDKVLDEVSKFTKGRMLDVVFEMAGSNDTVELGIDLLTMGGKFVAFGILPEKITFDYNKLIFKSIDVISINGRIMFDSWYSMLDTIKNEEVCNFVTHIVDFDDYEKAFNLLLNRQALKVVIKV